MDAETLICEAVHRFEHIENVLDIDWQPDAATCQRVGWHLVSQTGSAFRIGHRLLKLSSPSCPLMPPPEFRLCREIEPTADEMFDAGWIGSYCSGKAETFPPSGRSAACSTAATVSAGGGCGCCISIETRQWRERTMAGSGWAGGCTDD